MRQVEQGAARNVMVFMVDSADHITGKTGLTLTITISKDGAAFASATPTVTARGDGWYSLALTASHTDTLGDLAVHVTATGADPSDLALQVVRSLAGERTAMRGTVSTGSSTTSITTSALTPATTTANQIKDRVVIFDNDTTTAALRGQVAQITASTASATPTLTVSTMVATPASGDRFTVV
jgi:hypothetical protein